MRALPPCRRGVVSRGVHQTRAHDLIRWVRCLLARQAKKTAAARNLNHVHQMSLSARRLARTRGRTARDGDRVWAGSASPCRAVELLSWPRMASISPFSQKVALTQKPASCAMQASDHVDWAIGCDLGPIEHRRRGPAGDTDETDSSQCVRGKVRAFGPLRLRHRKGCFDRSRLTPPCCGVENVSHNYHHDFTS